MSHATVILGINGAFAENELEQAVTEQMAPFSEENGWFADGSRWDWWVIGGRYAGRFSGRNYIRKGDLNIEALLAERRAILEQSWNEAQERNEQMRDVIYGIKPGMTRKEYTTPHGPITGFALLTQSLLARDRADGLVW